jgi:hypothetical protein
LQGFWLPLPHLTGGSRLYDVSVYQRHLDLTNMDPATDWIGDADVPHPGLDFDGTDDRVRDDDSWPFDQPLTVAQTILDQGTQAATIWTHVKASSNSQWIRTKVDSGKFRLDINGGGFEGVETGASAYPTGEVVTLSASYKVGGGVRLYVDGEKVKTGTLSSASPSGGSLNRLALGTLDRSSTTKFLDGQIYDTALLSRAPSDQWHEMYYDQARRGFPDLLRRRSDVGLFGGGGGPTADTVSFDTATALADGFDPTITATANTVSPGTAQAAAQGFSATVTATQNTVSVGTAQATAQGFAPTITADDNTIAATTGQAAAQGFDPTISEGAAGDTITANLGTAQAQGFAPSITTSSATVTLGLGQAADKGFDPDVVADPSVINTQQGQAAATGFDPSITPSPRTVSVQTAQADAEGFEPAVVDGTVGVATTMEIEARPKYEITLTARPLYRIQLFAKEKLP